MISVIIPVYNTEEYLPQCLDSLIAQTYRNLEIICVNDGSTDESLKVLSRYVEKDARVTVLSQKNRGVSAARNAGNGRDTGDDAERADGDAHGCQPRLRPFAGIGQFPAGGRGADNIRQELSG